MTSTNSELNQSELRKFGFVTAGMLLLFFVVLIPYIWNLEMPIWPWVIASLLGLFALVAPTLLRPIYKGWMKFAEILGWINTRLILGIVFYFLFVPVGIIARIFNDPMQRRIDVFLNSYRIKSRSPNNSNLEKPF